MIKAREWLRGSLIVLLVLPLHLPHAFGQGRSQTDPLHETFYAPFEGSPDAVIAGGDSKPGKAAVNEYEAGPVGKAAHSKSIYNGIYWDGRGNIDLDRGTVSLFYKPNYDIDVTASRTLAGVSSDLEGHWLDVWQITQIQDSLYLQWFDLAPQIQSRMYMEGYWGRLADGQQAPPGLRFGKIIGRWKKGEWVHLAMVWDRTQGIKIYENGKLADSTWGKMHWDWNYDPRILHLGETIYSTSDFSADELHVYSECLTDAQIAQLAHGQKPTGKPMKAPRLNRQAGLARMGWAPADLPQIDVLQPGKPVQMTFAQVESMYDARRRIAQPFEGFKATNWPLTKYGASSKGRLLEMNLRPGQSYDRMRLFCQRPFIGALKEPGGKTLLEVGTDRPIWRGRLGELHRDTALHLQRHSGKIGQIDFYRTEPAPTPGSATLTFHTAQRLDPIPLSQAGKVLLGEVTPALRNAVRATTAGGAAFEVKSPACGGVQILSDVLPGKTATDGVLVQLVTGRIGKPTPVRVTVKEPVWPQRDWLVGDVVLAPSHAGRNEYTLVLKGRPVVTPPAESVEVPANGGHLKQPPVELAVTIAAAEDVTWRMGEGGTAVSLLLADLNQVLPTAIADQIEYAREAYAEENEGHVWDIEAFESYGRIAWPLLYLANMAPNERPVRQLMTRLYWTKGDLPYTEPQNSVGAPEWAFWQLEAMKENERIVRWIIDNHQLPNGEMGGVWGDDTDLVENWVDFVLMGDDDHKIRDGLRKLYAGVFRENLVDGLSATVQDALHSYEEGMGTIANQLVVDYGNPTAIEHTMRAASHYDMLMKRNPDGSTSYRGNYWGAPGVWDYGAFGKDDGVNGLGFVPAAYLIWYNHHPAPQPWIKGWTFNKNTYGGIVTGALYDLMTPEEREDFRNTHYTKVANELMKYIYVQYMNAVLDIIPAKEDWKPSMMGMAQWMFLKDIPPTSSYAIHMTEHHWLAYRATGDIKYVVDSYKKACRMINNLDWTYTVAEPSTDRIPLPHSSLSRARLGAFAVNRAGNGHFWPFHGISYTAGAEQVAAFVTENTEGSLKVKLWSFDAAPHLLQARVWRLWPGSYKVTLANDRNDDGAPEETIWQTTMTLERGSYLDLRLPSRQGVLLTITALQKSPMNYDRPDPAIGFDDVTVNAKGELQVTVHNVGIRPTGRIGVRVLDAQTSAVLATTEVAPLEAPLDLKPRSTTVTFPTVKPAAGAKLTVELQVDGPDLDPFNNRVEFPN